jgi:UDP-N-acetylmuramoylalanine--D-glutamate ligase
MSYPWGMERGMDLNGRRAVVVGLAREGEALTHFLLGRGCRVLATDLRAPAAFGDRLAALAAAGVELVLGEHPPAVLDQAEIVFVSPGVPFDAPLLQAARARGVALSTESRLFCQLCPAPIAAITGSSGKTTTTTLVGEMLKAAHYRTWVGGNIGQPLINNLDDIEATDRVVMELSSFQLEYFHPSANAHVRDVHPVWLPLLSGWSPSVGAILNVTPNHLDRHPTMEAYLHAKRAIVAYRRPWDVAVLGRDNVHTRALGETIPGDVRWFSRKSAVACGAHTTGSDRRAAIVLRCASSDESATATSSDPAVLRTHGERWVCQIQDLRLRGDHNVENVLAACAIADALGVSLSAMRQVATTFSGVRHRLERVAEIGGVGYYNDSIATSPERLVAALRAFDEPIVLLAGGRDKHLPWEEAAQLILTRTRHVILFGEAAELIVAALERARTACLATSEASQLTTVHRCVRLEDAVALAGALACPGDVVLLSPGCTSFDAFADFAERGDRFRELVSQMETHATDSGRYAPACEEHL